jgi:hypothetical protein
MWPPVIRPDRQVGSFTCLFPVSEEKIRRNSKYEKILVLLRTGGLKDLPEAGEMR